MKVQILEPVNMFVPKICLNKPIDTGTDFDSIELVTKEIKFMQMPQ